MRGDGSIYLRGATYWMKFYRDGRPISMSCETTSKDVARTKLRAEIRKSDDEFNEPRHKRVTITDLYKNLLLFYDASKMEDRRAGVESIWRLHLEPVFGAKRVVQFGSTDQHAYRASRVKAGTSHATVNRELQVLRRMFQLGYEQEPPLVKRMPKFHIMTENNARRVFANTAQVAAIKLAAAEHSLEMRVFVEIAHIYGWRRSEIHKRLQVKNLHFAENTIRLEDSKNHDAREVPMTPAIRTLLEALVVGKKPEDRLFWFGLSTLQDNWNKIVTKAGCPDIHIHDMRRTSARSKRAAGVDTSVTMAIMGWRTDAMFRRYGIVAVDDTQRALDKQDVWLQNGYNDPEKAAN